MLEHDRDSALTSDQQRARVKAERYSRGKTPHTIFTWWARRPFAAIESALGYAVEHVVRSRGEDPPTQLTIADIFSGGATIPLTAAAMGHRAVAIENNELAAFINETLLKRTQTAHLAPLVDRYGAQLLRDLAEQTVALFPLRAERVTAYFWSRSLRCPGCAALLSLQKRPWLAKRVGRQLSIRRSPDPGRRRYSTEISDQIPVLANSSWRANGSVRCAFCDATFDKVALSRVWEANTVEEHTAVCTLTARGKRYDATAEGAGPGIIATATARCDEELSRLDAALPSVLLPKWSGIVNPPLYGIASYADLLNPRQTAVMLTLCRLLREQHVAWVAAEGQETADAILAVLSALIDQLADWNSRLSMWIAQNEQVGRALSGPGLPMMWDYVEIDPLGDGPANLREKLRRITAGLRAIPRFALPAVVHRADARDRTLAASSVDIVAIDPPYYDNLFYSVLADAIYVWKRLALQPAFPESFAAPVTDSLRELTAASHRHSGTQGAHDYYVAGMSAVLTECMRVLAPDGVLVLVFAHASVEGWASLYDAVTAAGLAFFAAVDLEAERKRPRSMAAGAVDTSFVFFGRHAAQKPLVSADAVSLQVTGTHPRTSLTAFGQVFARATQVVVTDANGALLGAHEIVLTIGRLLEASFGPSSLVRRGTAVVTREGLAEKHPVPKESPRVSTR